MFILFVLLLNNLPLDLGRRPLRIRTSPPSPGWLVDGGRATRLGEELRGAGTDARHGGGGGGGGAQTRPRRELADADPWIPPPSEIIRMDRQRWQFHGVSGK